MENFNTLMSKILSGDTSVHDPIVVRLTNTTSEDKIIIFETIFLIQNLFLN